MAVAGNEMDSTTDLLTCPYNKSHSILPQRMQVHLIRCRRSYPNAAVVICPFNVTHRVNKVELEWHVKTCPNRQNFELIRDRDASNSGVNSTFSGESVNNSTVLTNKSNIIGGEYMESTECWDDEPAHPGYNPMEYVQKADVLRLPVGMTPSERKAFRLAELKRLQKMKQ